ncbi:enoyl-CoA hydratase/isomerase family protein [Nioella aestuarii]|uniref:enoyl-CoA hydratase/isomerase family protein n=1 Tax=Nioella aestuarii TaxID=1662864 RepID=UPI003D7FF4AF
MSTVHLISHGAVAEIRLDNPDKLNAFTPEMLESLEAHCSALERDREARAVVVSAAPSRAFCAGADITAWAPLPPGEFARGWVRDGHRIFDRLARLSKPTVAAIGAHAFGGGLELAATCDIRVISPTATIALPEANVGIVPGWSGTQRLARLLPEPVIKEMALFGQRLGAERTLALGFVAEISEDVNAASFALAERAAGLSPMSVETAKYMLHAAVGEDRAAMVEALGGGMVSATNDRQEGVRAFQEKRKPKFTGE